MEKRDMFGALLSAALPAVTSMLGKGKKKPKGSDDVETKPKSSDNDVKKVVKPSGGIGDILGDVLGGGGGGGGVGDILGKVLGGGGGGGGLLEKVISGLGIGGGKAASESPKMPPRIGGSNPMAGGMPPTIAALPPLPAPSGPLTGLPPAPGGFPPAPGGFPPAPGGFPPAPPQSGPLDGNPAFANAFGFASGLANNPVPFGNMLPTSGGGMMPSGMNPIAAGAGGANFMNPMGGTMPQMPMSPQMMQAPQMMAMAPMIQRPPVISLGNF